MLQSVRSICANLALKRKIQAAVLLASLLLIAAAIMGNLAVSAQSTKLLYTAMSDSLSYTGAEIADVLDSADQLSLLMISDASLQAQLSTAKDSENPILRRRAYERIYSLLSTYYQQFRDNVFISYISMYDARHATHSYSVLAQQVPSEVIYDLRTQARSAQGKSVWVTDYAEEYGLFLVREVRRTRELQLDSLGEMVICVSPQALMRSINVSGQEQPPRYVISDAQGILYRSDTLSDADVQQLQRMTVKHDVQQLSDGAYFAVQGAVPGYPWTHTSLIPYTSIQRSIHQSNFANLLAILAASCIGLLAAGRIASSVSRHFERLIQKMQHFGEEGNTLEPSPYDYSARTDEVAILHKQFDCMAAQLCDLIDKNYKAEILCRDAQLKALQMQVNPHFLYNTLESVNWRAKAAGETQISQMTEALGKTLRITLDKRNDCFTFANELELVESYMTIQRIRFEDRLQYDTDLAPELLSIRLPRLTLQPLIENAIQYALEDGMEDCAISICATHNRETVHIHVRNTGSEFPENFASDFQANAFPTHGMGIALKNIDERLKLTFGAQCGLSFPSACSCAEVEIQIPYNPVKVEESDHAEVNDCR